MVTSSDLDRLVVDIDAVIDTVCISARHGYCDGYTSFPAQGKHQTIPLDEPGLAKR
jgi:hypothetical protein